MVVWHHQLNGHVFETLGDSEEPGILACCSPWGRKKLDTTEQLNNGNNNNKTNGEGIKNNNFYHPVSCRQPLLTYSAI